MSSRTLRLVWWFPAVVALLGNGQADCRRGGGLERARECLAAAQRRSSPTGQ